VAAILKEFGGLELELPEIKEKPEPAHTPNFLTERPQAAYSPVYRPARQGVDRWRRLHEAWQAVE
jgi:hypothetical protein